MLFCIIPIMFNRNIRGVWGLYFDKFELPMFFACILNPKDVYVIA